MTDDNDRGVRLQVANARSEDAGRGIARMDQGVMQTIDVREGDPCCVPMPSQPPGW